MNPQARTYFDRAEALELIGLAIEARSQGKDALDVVLHLEGHDTLGLMEDEDERSAQPRA
jgi:hypothetical protein